MALRPGTPNSNDQLAQRKAAQDEVFLKEVDDALRQDQLQSAFRRWGTTLGIAMAAVLLGLAGYLYWDHRSKAQAGVQGEQFTKALDSVQGAQFDSAAKQLGELAKTSNEGTRAAAQILQAGIALRQNRRDEGIKLLEGLAADDSVPQPYRDLATIRAVTANFDSMKPEDVVTRLKPLAVPGSPWFAGAGELLGLAYLKQGKNDLAGPLFASIARDKDSPQTSRARTRQLAGLLGVDAIDDVARAAGTQPGQ